MRGAELARSGNRISARVRQVAGVEAEAEHVRIGPVHQIRNLLRRLDVGRAVMMEHRAEARRVANRACNALGVRSEDLAGRYRQTKIIGDPPGCRCPLRARRDVVGEDDEGGRESGISQQRRRPDRGRFAGVVRGRVLQADGDERTEQRQRSRGECVPQLAWVGGHETPVTEFGAGVSRIAHFIENARVVVTGG